MRDNVSTWWWLIWSLWLAGNALLYPLVWSGMIEVCLILFNCPMQMSLTQDEEKVQALSSHAAQKALTDGVCFRRAIRSAQYLKPCPLVLDEIARLIT